MQLLQSGNMALVLENEDNIVTLEKAVNRIAMTVYMDACAYFNKKKNENGEFVSEDTLRLEMDVLNSLSNALSATSK